MRYVILLEAWIQDAPTTWRLPHIHTHTLWIHASLADLTYAAIMAAPVSSITHAAHPP